MYRVFIKYFCFFRRIKEKNEFEYNEMDNFIIEMTVDTNYPLMRIEDFNPRLLE